jgi:hypothetical protein
MIIESKFELLGNDDDDDHSADATYTDSPTFYGT